MFVFVLIVVLRPGKQFFSHVETEPPIPGYYQYFECEIRFHPAGDVLRIKANLGI